jgi:membrane associated rhomboid family serine protease
VASEARDCLGVFAFVLWWKGSLMLEYDKQYETLGWAALTGATWTILRVAGILPERVRTLTRGQMLGGLLFGVSLFFLVMSAVDPLVQLGIQRMAWSSGLAIEVGFFVPAGIVLLGLSRRLRRDTRWPATERERTHHG